jgi:hypothetical protein
MNTFDGTLAIYLRTILLEQPGGWLMRHSLWNFILVEIQQDPV